MDNVVEIILLVTGEKIPGIFSSMQINLENVFFFLVVVVVVGKMV